MAINPNQIKLDKSADGGRYFYSLPDGAEAEMVYVRQRPGVVTITHTETPRQHRGQGVAASLVSRAVEDFRAAGDKVIPACWFAREEFERRPEWGDVLFRREETKG